MLVAAFGFVSLVHSRGQHSTSSLDLQAMLPQYNILLEHHSCDQFTKGNKSALKRRETDLTLMLFFLFRFESLAFFRLHCFSSSSYC